MKIGDIVTDILSKKWIVYDIQSELLVYVTDVETQRQNVVIAKTHILNIEEKPKNVEWLFLRRRQKELTGLEKFV
jgi:hypothetical protein